MFNDCHPPVLRIALGMSNCFCHYFRIESWSKGLPLTSSSLESVHALYTSGRSRPRSFSYLNKADWSELASYLAPFHPRPQPLPSLPPEAPLDLWPQRLRGADGLSSRNAKNVVGSLISPHLSTSEITSLLWMTLVSTSKCVVTSSSIS